MVKKLTLIGLLSLLPVAAFYAWRLTWSAPPQRTPVSLASEQKGATPLPPPSILSIPEKRLELLAWGRNPFLTPEEEEGKGKKQVPQQVPQSEKTPIPTPNIPILVSAIILQGARKVATVNNQIVMVGDLLGEETVSDIKADRIVLEGNGKRREILVRQSPISITVHPPEGNRGMD